MLAPFKGKGPLGAHVGTREDTSSSKFKDTLISDFFGPKQIEQGKASKAASTSRTVVAVDSAITSVRPPETRKLEKEVMGEEELKEKEAGEFQEREFVLEPTNSTFGFLIGALVTAVLLTSRLGKSPR
jgi:hypothetical protein